MHVITYTNQNAYKYNYYSTCMHVVLYTYIHYKYLQAQHMQKITSIYKNSIYLHKYIMYTYVSRYARTHVHTAFQSTYVRMYMHTIILMPLYCTHLNCTIT